MTELQWQCGGWAFGTYTGFWNLCSRDWTRFGFLAGGGLEFIYPGKFSGTLDSGVVDCLVLRWVGTGYYDSKRTRWIMDRHTVMSVFVRSRMKFDFFNLAPTIRRGDKFSGKRIKMWL